MANPLPNKHVVAHQVFEALGEGGCPVCRLGLKAVWRDLDALSYECVNDPVSRAELRAARGFCNYHAWQFADEIHDGLGTAIIYRDITNTMLHVLGAADLRPASLAAQLAPQQECPACRGLERSCRRYLDTLLEQMSDPSFRAHYVACDGLCLPHLVEGLQRARSWRDFDLLASAFAQRATALADPAGADAATLAEALAGARGAVHSFEAPSLEGDTGAWDMDRLMGKADPQAGQPPCPVCSRVASTVDAWLAALSADTAPRHLCNTHTWRLLQVNKRPGVAGVLAPQAVRASQRLQGLKAADVRVIGDAGRLEALLGRPRMRRAMKAAAQTLLPEAPCAACALQAAVENETVTAILAGASAGQDHSALCVQHFRLALMLASSAGQAALVVESETAALRTLQWNLSEYIRKQDYRFRHEPIGEEAGAPWDAIVQVAGGKGLREQRPGLHVHRQDANGKP